MNRPYVRNAYRTSGIAYKNEQILTIDNFGGGMNNVEPDTVVEDNESTNCKNMMFIANSLMESRFGTKYVNEDFFTDITTIVEDEIVGVPITWVDEYKPLLGDSQFVRATANEMYIGNEKICDVLGNIRGASYIGKYYFVDGKHLYVYDGDTYFQVCDVHSYLTEEVAANGKDFYVKDIPNYVTTSNSLYFILPDGTKKALTITALDRENMKITVATGHTAIVPKETIVYFYVPLDKDNYLEGTEVWDTVNHYAYYEPCENQLNDDFAGTPYLPDSPEVIVVHKDRLFITGDSEQPHGVYMSAIAAISPLYFPVNAGVGAKPNGDKIIDLVVFDNALIIGRHNDMYVLYGNSEYQDISSDPFYIKQMDVSVGFMCAGCGALINNFYIYLGYDGRFYRLNTPTTFVEYLMTKPLDWKINLYSDPFNFPVETELDVSAVSYFNEVYFSIGKNCVFVYNYDVMGWTYYTGFQESFLYSDGMNLYIGRSDGKFTVFDKSGINYNDIGIPVESVYETKRFDFGASATFKYFTKFMVSSHAWQELLSYINVAIEIDLRTLRPQQPLASNTTRFGIAIWGASVFNDKSLVKSGWRSLDFRGRTIKFKFSNNDDNQPFRLYDINIGYTLRDVR